MVLFAPVAAAISTGAGAGATALGLNLDKQSVELTRECFLLQMRQAKRLFTAQWAEAAYHHGEAMAQAAQQHAEAQALATAQYFQTERIHSESTKLARDQDTRAYEMAWRTEARESLRDELTNQFNRYNIIMLVDAVCMGSIMPLVESGEPPQGITQVHLAFYLFSLGSCTMLFIVSLWFCLVVTRRLHEHTAAILERRLFADTEELQKVWQDQIENGLPTDSLVLNLLNQAYKEWVSRNIDPLGNAAIQALSIGVIFMFVTAGLLTHARYMIDHNAPIAVSCFWFAVVVAIITVTTLKCREEAKERTKQGCYDKSWLDIPTTVGPMAKIATAGDQLFSPEAVRLGSNDRRDQYKDREQTERAFVAQPEALYAKADCLLSDAGKRAIARKGVLEALTAASEEIDALPEDLIASLNDLIHQVSDLDNTTAKSVSMPSRCSEKKSEPEKDDSTLEEELQMKTPMKANPIDAHRTPVSLNSLRAKLGEIALTTLMRIRNRSDEPLRIKSGLQLSNGKYIKDIEVMLLANKNPSLATEKPGSKVTYHLFPIEEIPPRTEVVIAARSEGRNWIPTSGIKGDLLFVNNRQTVSFQISFSNSFNSNGRTCIVNSSDGQWRISQETIDHQKNHEVLVQIENRHRLLPFVHSSASLPHQKEQNLGDDEELHHVSAGIAAGPHPSAIDKAHTETSPAAFSRGGATSPTTTLEENEGLNSTIRMRGFLSLQVVGLQALWQKIFCKLTSRSLTLTGPGGEEVMEILLQHVTKVQAIPNTAAHNYTFDVYSTERKPVRLAAATSAERDQWIRKISDAKGRDIADWGSLLEGDSDLRVMSIDNSNEGELQHQSLAPVSAGHHPGEIDERHTEPSPVAFSRGDASFPSKGLLGNESLNSTNGMKGFLSLQIVGFQALWHKVFCTLTPKSLTLTGPEGKEEMNIFLQNVTKVQAIPNTAARNYAFDIYCTERKPVRLAANTSAERDQWIRKISDAKGRDIADWGSLLEGDSDLHSMSIDNPKEEEEELQHQALAPIAAGHHPSDIDERHTEPSPVASSRGGALFPTTTFEENGGLKLTIRMRGFLSLQVVGLQALWQKVFCTLTPRSLTLSGPGGKEVMEILLKIVTKVQAIPNTAAHNYAFDIYCTERKPVRLAATTSAERDQWIRKISDAKGRDIADWGSLLEGDSDSHSMSIEKLPV